MFDKSQNTFSKVLHWNTIYSIIFEVRYLCGRINLFMRKVRAAQSKGTR